MPTKVNADTGKKSNYYPESQQRYKKKYAAENGRILLEFNKQEKQLFELITQRAASQGVSKTQYVKTILMDTLSQDTACDV